MREEVVVKRFAGIPDKEGFEDLSE